MEVTLKKIIERELSTFNKLNNTEIIKESIPILWFGDLMEYKESKTKVLTVSINPSSREFQLNGNDEFSTETRFPSFNGKIEGLFNSYNEYFKKEPYNQWFKSSFSSVLDSFSASFYSDNQSQNRALHTDICSPYATSPTWSHLTDSQKTKLMKHGTKLWHEIVTILEPDVILFSASRGFHELIEFEFINKWDVVDKSQKSPILKSKIRINKKICDVIYQIQGRKPFLYSTKECKLKYADFLK